MESSSSSSSDLSSLDYSDTDGDHALSRPPVPVPVSRSHRKRQQFFAEPRLCVNCHFKFERSAQYSGHLKQCRPDKPWNGVPTRAPKSQAPLKKGAATDFKQACGPDGARVQKTVPTRRSANPAPAGPPMASVAERVSTPSSPVSRVATPSEEADTSPRRHWVAESPEMAAPLSSSSAAAAGAPTASDYAFTGFVREHMDMISPCTTRVHLEFMDAHLQGRINALQRMRTITQAGIRRFQLAEASVIKKLDDMHMPEYDTDDMPIAASDTHDGL